MKKILAACLCVTMLSVGFVSVAAPAGYYAGDYDKNGIVAEEDLAVLRQALVKASVDAKYDLNDSDTVDVLDLVRLKQMTVIGFDDEMEAF